MASVSVIGRAGKFWPIFHPPEFLGSHPFYSNCRARWFFAGKKTPINHLCSEKVAIGVRGEGNGELGFHPPVFGWWTSYHWSSLQAWCTSSEWIRCSHRWSVSPPLMSFDFTCLRDAQRSRPVGPMIMPLNAGFTACTWTLDLNLGVIENFC